MYFLSKVKHYEQHDGLGPQLVWIIDFGQFVFCREEPCSTSHKMMSPNIRLIKRLTIGRTFRGMEQWIYLFIIIISFGVGTLSWKQILRMVESRSIQCLVFRRDILILFSGCVDLCNKYGFYIDEFGKWWLNWWFDLDYLGVLLVGGDTRKWGD